MKFTPQTFFSQSDFLINSAVFPPNACQHIPKKQQKKNMQMLILYAK